MVKDHAENRYDWLYDTKQNGGSNGLEVLGLEETTSHKITRCSFNGELLCQRLDDNRDALNMCLAATPVRRCRAS